jgi:hypothetical protein
MDGYQYRCQEAKKIGEILVTPGVDVLERTMELTIRPYEVCCRWCRSEVRSFVPAPCTCQRAHALFVIAQQIFLTSGADPLTLRKPNSREIDVSLESFRHKKYSSLPLKNITYFFYLHSILILKLLGAFSDLDQFCTSSSRSTK